MRRFTYLILGLVLSGNFANAQNAKYFGEIINKVTQHITWPAFNNEFKFVVGVVGNKEDFRYFQLHAIEKGLAMHSTVEVRYFQCEDDLETCDFIYISDDSQIEMEKIVEKTSDKAILIVSGRKGYGDLGSVINFVDSEGKLHIEINLQQADRRALSVSNELKKLAIPIG